MYDWHVVGIAVSSISGWIYFIAWSASFWPQPLKNIKRQSTIGLVPDFPKLNTVGFTYYSISQLALLYSEDIRDQYAARHPLSPIPTTRFNDVAFGLHALLLCMITYSQFWPRLWGWKADDGSKQKTSKASDGMIAGSVLAVIIVSFLLTGTASWQALDIIYALQYTKLLLTVFKYCPQVVSNARRKSTQGWSIVQVQCDVVGSIFSMLQLIIDSAMQGDWSGITGNPVKFGLANISFGFDIIFCVQHYILYREPRADEDQPDERMPLLR